MVPGRSDLHTDESNFPSQWANKLVALPLPPFYRQEDRSTERLRNLPKVIQLRGTQIVNAPKSVP